MNVNFLHFKNGLTVSIPMVTVNEDQSPAIRRGAFFLHVTKYLKCKALSSDLPAVLNIDLAGAANKEVVRLNRVTIPQSIEPLEVHANFCVGTVVGKRIGDEETPAPAADAKAKEAKAKEAKAKEVKPKEVKPKEVKAK
jgi:hypothetical protein